MPDDSPERIDLGAVSARRPRRSLDERILVRFPSLARGLLALWSRLPRRSVLWRSVFARFAPRVAAAANRRDFDFMLLAIDPAVEYRVEPAGPGRDVVPEIVGTNHGHDGYMYVWRVMLDVFADMTLEPQEVLVLEDRVLSETRLSAHGAGSGAPIEQMMYQVFTLRRGLIFRQVDYWDRAEALEAIGLPPRSRRLSVRLADDAGGLRRSDDWNCRRCSTAAIAS